MKPGTVRSIRLGSLATAVVAFPVLIWMTWFATPDWTGASDVAAPLTRKILYYHPATAWAAFAAYFAVFAMSIAVLNERDARYDRPARAAAEVGFMFNTVALVTGTLWGIQEWSEAGQSSLATVYREPKVLVVVVLWLTFAAYLLLRRLVDAPERQARLAAIFGVLGFLGVPLSFATSRVLATSLHPDIAGPGKNPDAAVSGDVGLALAVSAVAFLALFIHLWLQRLRILDAQARLDLLESP